MACRQQVAAVLLSLEDELAVLDLRYAHLLHSVHSLDGSDDDDVEVHMHCLTLTQLRDKSWQQPHPPCPPSPDPAPTPLWAAAFSALTAASFLRPTLPQGFEAGHALVCILHHLSPL